MIKRRFYRLEHGNKENPSESASSSSDSELQGDASNSEEIEMEDADVEESNVVSDTAEKEASSSSGYETEGSSASELNLDSSELPASDDDKAAQMSTPSILKSTSHDGGDTATPSHCPEPFDVKDCVLKRKSVFKCKLCPRIVCLSEDTLRAHLNSKRHARSEKLYKAGRLKLMLNDDGQIEGEDYPKSHPATESSGQQKRRGSRRWKERKTKKSKRTYGRK